MEDKVVHAKIGKGGRERGERERAGRGQKAGRDGTGRHVTKERCLEG